MKSLNQIKKEQFEIQKAIKFLIDCCLDKEGKPKIANKKNSDAFFENGF